MKAALALAALALCFATAQADWINEMRLDLSNYALSPVTPPFYRAGHWCHHGGTVVYFIMHVA